MNAIRWIHPEPTDDGRAAMRRIGVGIGDEFLLAGRCSWARPEPEKLGTVRWQDGYLVVHDYRRYRVRGWYAPQYGDSDRGGVLVDPATDGANMVNVVIGELRTGNTTGDPRLKWPIARAP